MLIKYAGYDPTEAKFRWQRLGKVVVNPKPLPKPRIVYPGGGHYDKPIGPPWIESSYSRAKFIMAGIARAYGFTVDDLKSARQEARLCEARHWAMFVMMHATPYSYPHIGRWFNNRDHTTVMSACAKIKAQIEGREFRHSDSRAGRGRAK